ncbi:MAG: hypothetical protein AAGD92_07445 [Pseudomonadota bacterium]
MKAVVTRNGLIFLSLLLIAEIFFGTLLHEGAHWLAGELLGYDMQAGFGRAWSVGAIESENPVRDAQIITIAGPVFTVAVAFVGFLLCVFANQLWAYTLIFSALYQRALAMVLSYVSKPNDEARISTSLGWEWWVAPSIVVGFLLVLCVAAAWRHRIGWPVQLLFYVMCSIGYSLVVFVDGQFPGFRHASPVIFP